MTYFKGLRIIFSIYSVLKSYFCSLWKGSRSNWRDRQAGTRRKADEEGIKSKGKLRAQVEAVRELAFGVNEGRDLT